MTPAQAVAALRALQPKLATDYQGLKGQGFAQGWNVLLAEVQGVLDQTEGVT